MKSTPLQEAGIPDTFAELKYVVPFEPPLFVNVVRGVIVTTEPPEHAGVPATPCPNWIEDPEFIETFAESAVLIKPKAAKKKVIRANKVRIFLELERGLPSIGSS